MTKRRLFLIIVLFLTMLTGFRFLWVWASPHAIQPQLVKGVLDLRNKELNQDKLPLKNIYKSRISGTMPFIMVKSLLLASDFFGNIYQW